MSVKERGLQVLFVHGMGRSPLSGGLLLWLLKRAGLKLRVFGYSVSFDDFAGIRARLVERISQLAVQGDYVLVGHSLGGVLLRAALNDLPPDTRRASHLFLLGSPVRAARLPTLKVPKPTRVTLSPFFSACLTAEMAASSARPAAALEISASSAI